MRRFLTQSANTTHREAVGRGWKVSNPNGTCAEFKEYWTEIQKDSDRMKASISEPLALNRIMY